MHICYFIKRPEIKRARYSVAQTGRYVTPLAQVNAAGLALFMEAQKESMSKIFSHSAWSGVRLMSPGVSAMSMCCVSTLKVGLRLTTSRRVVAPSLPSME